MNSAVIRLAFEAGDVTAVVRYFAGRSEAQRRAVAPDVFRWSAGAHASDGDRRKAVVAALLACATLTELTTSLVPLAGDLGDAAYAILAERQPRWLDAWVEFLLARRRPVWSPPHWVFCRRLIREGLCSRPEYDEYIIEMMRAGIAARGADALVNALRRDPGLLEYEVWRLFEVEGGNRGRNLNTFGNAWSGALLRLSSDGALSRVRMLDATVDALARDFSDYNARWFRMHHAQLSPDVDELAARAPRYIDLLSVRLPLTVDLSLAVLEKLHAAGRLDERALLDGLDATVAGGVERNATRALRLVDAVLRRSPHRAAEGVRVAGNAFGNASIDVQRRALRVVMRLGNARDPVTRADLADAAGLLAPSLRAQLDAWVRPSDQGPGAARSTHAALDREAEHLRAVADALPVEMRRRTGVDEVLRALDAGASLPRGLSFRPADVPLRGSRTAITPVRNLEELVDLLARLLETGGGPDGATAEDVERAIGGVSSMSASRPPRFDLLTAPLRKRAIAVLNHRTDTHSTMPFWSGDPRDDICGLTVAWLTGTVPPYRGVAPGAAAFLSYRVLEVAVAAAARRPRTLLATPTHRGGWVHPDVLLERIERTAAAGEAVGGGDAVQAILRLMPDATGATSSRARRRSGDLALAVRVATGDQAAPPPHAAALRLAATATRAMAAGEGPEDGVAAMPDLMTLFESPPLSPPHVLATRTSRWLWNEASIRWVASWCPSLKGGFLESAETCLAARATGSPARGLAFVEPLLDSDIPLDVPALRVLLLGLGCRDFSIRATAVAALLAAAADGRLDASSAGAALGTALASGAVDARRVAAGLTEVAADGPLASETARVLLEATMASLAVSRPSGSRRLVELLLQLCSDARASVVSAEARGWLTGASASAALRPLARELLALDGGAGVHARAACIEALRGRLERAERWLER